MPLENFRIKSRLGDYPVLFGEPEAYLPRLAAEPGCAWVVDENVWRLHRDGALAPLARLAPIILPVSEEAKTLATVQRLYDEVIRLATKKNTRLVSVGGGITQDITGFAASTLYRGVKWTYIPTTLLAQADSCIGGKTSLNYGEYKNLVGTFFPPSEIYVSASFLATLRREDHLSGLGEIAKLCVIAGRADAEAFAAAAPALAAGDLEALRPFLRRALEIKKGFIEEDEFDAGRRNLLNYGHCFGHALEAATAYAVPHGTAVVYGMLLANAAARRRGLLSAENEAFLRERLLRPLLPAGGPPAFDPAAALEAMKKDKKRTGEGLPLVMAADGYRLLRVQDLRADEALAALEEVAGSGGRKT